ncbi:MAG: SDR family NAD(P)-dependent oxidoreductase, partial [bacterium]
MKNIFITGGNRGIGKGLVEIFSENNKVFFSARDKQKARSVIESIGNENIDYVIMDVSDERNVLNGIESLKEKTDSIDILINNAGILIPGLKHKIDAV